MNKWLTALFAALAVALIPSQAFAAEASWEDAEPLFLTILIVLSIASLLYFIYSMIRNV
ncbi:hypothetical protein [Alteribacillus iranensis]|uniref:Uncharacterized protein n=1 Tax=Alteribacillus iranensis TaxID=930128 RepID=A0A1I1ZTN4_9BACI|nr:hypothetical protein [Alteribacillus iranensis]SFE34972.1 hypothetical protein SAMN05192532_101435 [Alteribacillus iranensis]